MSANDSKSPASHDLGGRLSGLMPYLGLVGFVVSLAVRLVGDFTDWKVTRLELLLFWMVGVQGSIVGAGHMFMPAQVAHGIGWQPSPFQWEVGLADLGFGVLG